MPSTTPDNSWKKPLTGLFDAFSDVATLTRRWRLAGYQGCVDAGSGGGGLMIGLECGADQAVSRARARVELAPNDELGRIAVLESYLEIHSTGTPPGFAGFEVWLDGQPTDTNGPGLGGRYTVVFSAGALSPGKHTVNGSLAPVSTLKDVTVT